MPLDDLIDRLNRMSFVRSPAFPRVMLSILAVLLLIDIAGDIFGDTLLDSDWIEFIVRILTLISAGFIWYQWGLERRQRHETTLALKRASADAAKWRSEAEQWRRQAHEALAGLGENIDRQFEIWRLSPAEKEVALLLLKGLSHKEVAAVRGSSERTVRQQALSIYQRGGLAGRAELSAFFLEDLLLPKHQREK